MTDDRQPGDSASVVRGLFGRDMLYLGAWASQLVLAAALTPAFTRLMAPSAYGAAAAATAVMQLLNALLCFSLQTAVQRAYAGDDGEQRARRLVTLSIVIAVVLGGVAYFTGSWWCPLIGLGQFPAAVRFAVVWAVMTAITNPALGLVRSRDRFASFMAASLSQSVVAQALALICVIALQGSAANYMLGQLLGQILAGGIAVFAAGPALIRMSDRPMIVDSLRFSIGLVPALIAGFIGDASDRLVIHGDLGAQAVSHYTLARTIGGFTGILLPLLDFVWLPRLFAIKDPEARRAVLGMSRDGLYVLVVACAVAIAAASPLILSLWAPADYHPQSLLLITALVAAAAVPLADALVYSEALIINGRTRPIAVATFTTAVLNLVLNLLLVPALGINGSAAITFVCCVGDAVILRVSTLGIGPRTNVRALGITCAGVGVCLASAAVPSFGIALAGRLLVVAACVVLFTWRLVTLGELQNHPRIARFARLARVRPTGV